MTSAPAHDAGRQAGAAAAGIEDGAVRVDDVALGDRHHGAGLRVEVEHLKGDGLGRAGRPGRRASRTRPRGPAGCRPVGRRACGVVWSDHADAGVVDGGEVVRGPVGGAALGEDDLEVGVGLREERLGRGQAGAASRCRRGRRPRPTRSRRLVSACELSRAGYGGIGSPSSRQLTALLSGLWGHRYSRALARRAVHHRGRHRWPGDALVDAPMYPYYLLMWLWTGSGCLIDAGWLRLPSVLAVTVPRLPGRPHGASARHGSSRVSPPGCCS